MKLSSPVILLLAVVSTATSAIGQPPASTIRPEPIARAARYGGKLTVRELSAADGQVWAASVTAADQSFAPVTIILKDAGPPPTGDKAIATVMRSPDGQFDLMVSIQVPAEFPTPTLAAARYRSLLEREPRELVNAIALSVHRQLFPPPRHQGTKGTKQD